jgi:membrane fusion protein (multidrug efflux system)
MQRFVYPCLLIAALSVNPVWGAETTDTELPAITRPSKEVSLSFEVSGTVAEVLVKDGDRVSPGDVLVKLDDTVQRIKAKNLKADAENDTSIKAAAARLAQSEVELKRLQDLARKNVATEWELEQAKLDKIIRELSLELAKLELDKARIAYEQHLATLDLMSLESGIDGVIETVDVEIGEAVDGLQPVVQIVKLDPLWIEVPVPIDQARSLQLRQQALAHVSDGTVLRGQIIHKSAVADAASATLTVRVQVANPQLRPAGEHVTVNFQTSLAPAPTQTGQAESEHNPQAARPTDRQQPREDHEPQTGA